MLTKNQIKFIQSLSKKKFRQEAKQFIIEGEKLIQEAINNNFEFVFLFTTSDTPVFDKSTKITKIEMDKISCLSSSSSYFAVLKFQDYILDDYNFEKGLTLILDDVKDPGNLGTIIRIADWYGVKQIVCSKETVELWNSKVVQSTMGSIFRVPVFYTDLDAFLDENRKTKPVFSTDLKGDNLYTNSSIEIDVFILMGSESHGVSSNYDKYIQEKIFIPRIGQAESLNVGVATAIVLAEFTRSIHVK